MFWDFDGTLVYSNSLWTRSLHSALTETDTGSQVQFEELYRCMKYRFPWNHPEGDYSEIVLDKWWDFVNESFCETYIRCGVSEEIAQAAARKVRTIVKRKENYRLYEDSMATLKDAKQKGYANVILSNNYPELIEVLEKLGLMEYLDGAVVSAVEGFDKPRRELFQIAKERFPGDEYYMVGDNPEADIAGGKNANMKTILVHRGYAEAADYCLADLRSVCDILGENQEPQKNKKLY